MILLGDQETLVVKSGVENSLGILGGHLFLLPSRTVSISDFTLDFVTKRLTFFGMCSSGTNPLGRPMKIVLKFEDQYKLFKRKIFFKDPTSDYISNNP